MVDYVDRLLIQLLHNMIAVHVVITKFIIICSIQMVLQYTKYMCQLLYY